MSVPPYFGFSSVAAGAGAGVPGVGVTGAGFGAPGAGDGVGVVGAGAAGLGPQETRITARETRSAIENWVTFVFIVSLPFNLV